MLGDCWALLELHWVPVGKSFSRVCYNTYNKIRFGILKNL